MMGLHFTSKAPPGHRKESIWVRCTRYLFVVDAVIDSAIESEADSDDSDKPSKEASVFTHLTLSEGLLTHTSHTTTKPAVTSTVRRALLSYGFDGIAVDWIRKIRRPKSKNACSCFAITKASFDCDSISLSTCLSMAIALSTCPSTWLSMSTSTATILALRPISHGPHANTATRTVPKATTTTGLPVSSRRSRCNASPHTME
mmetsp:Transcript_33018/g.53075  ORF Transcript_33018/g.53075 Transcript_33018/m.53075 type:complete len:202 (-) Transcript_33018:359-964(-)